MGSSGATLGVGGNWGPITRLSLWDLCHTNLLMATCFATKSCKCVNLSSLSARLGWNQFSSKDVRRCRSLSGLGSIWWLGHTWIDRGCLQTNLHARPSERGITASSESSLEMIKPTRPSLTLILLLYALIRTHDNQQYSILKMSPSARPFPQQTHYKRAASQQGEKQA